MQQKQLDQKLDKKLNELEKKLTEARKREEVMKENVEKYRQLFENESDAVMVFDAGTLKFEDANRATLNLYGYSKQEFLALNVEDISAEKEKTRIAVQKVKHGEPGTENVVLRYFRKKGGTVFPGEICAGTFISSGRKKIIGAVRDITERKRMEEELRESEETLKAILAACPVGVGLVCNQTLDWANTAMYRILGYEEGSLLGQEAKALYIDDEECNRVGRELYPEMDETGIGQTETRWIRKEGGIIDCHLQASPLNPNDPEKGLIVAAMDITDRKRAEKHIHALTQQLMKAQENERQRISRYLHDDVAQNLSTLKIGLETIFDDQPTPPHELTQRVLSFSQILQTAISAVRDLAYDQNPPSLDQLGLVQAVFQYCESFSRKHGLRVDFHSAGMDDLKLDFDTEINLYRLIQEALTNVKKHADASRATVRLVATHPNIILRIEDDGKGFDVEGRLLRALDEKRMGLQGMEERVNLLNGILRIQSRLGEGTKIFVEVPYRERKIGSEKKHPNH